MLPKGIMLAPQAYLLAWLLTRPSIISVLIGARRLSRLEENINAAYLELEDEDLKKPDDFSDPGSPDYPKWMVFSRIKQKTPGLTYLNQTMSGGVKSGKI